MAHENSFLESYSAGNLVREVVPEMSKAKLAQLQQELRVRFPETSGRDISGIYEAMNRRYFELAFPRK